MWVEKYIGIPYVKYGRDEKGCDCWGLCRIIYKDMLGIELNDLSECYVSDTKRQFFNGITKTFSGEVKSWQKVDLPMAFDIVAFGSRHLIKHVGVMIDSVSMIHIENRAGSCVQKCALMGDLYGYYRYS